jgi:ribosomal protein L5
VQGVVTVLRGELMLNFLEKLVYMILPSQIGFDGSAPFQVHEAHN